MSYCTKHKPSKPSKPLKSTVTTSSACTYRRTGTFVVVKKRDLKLEKLKTLSLTELLKEL